MRIDAHQHFWKISRGDYGWLTADALPTIYRDFSAHDLRPLLHEARIDKTILVQAAESIAETEFLLRTANEADFVAGVVGWADLASPQATDQIAALAENSKLVGLRPMLQDMADTHWIVSAEIAPALREMQKRNLRFDALIRPAHLPAIHDLAVNYPELSIVVDHAAKPFIAAREIEKWREHMRSLATLPNVYCKLSGLATEAGEDWGVATLQPYIDVLLDHFGPSRLMWGSDWPVLLLAGNYAQWLRAAEETTRALSSVEREQIFGGTAAAFYGITND
jgi:L-fuconolactonase